MDFKGDIPLKKELLERIIKARESIKRKHLALKLGRENAEQMINEFHMIAPGTMKQKSYTS